MCQLFFCLEADCARAIGSPLAHLLQRLELLTDITVGVAHELVRDMPYARRTEH